VVKLHIGAFLAGTMAAVEPDSAFPTIGFALPAWRWWGGYAPRNVAAAILARMEQHQKATQLFVNVALLIS
jgi:hypothetical protein